jgi:5-hydroxyisourate hydrolase
MDGISTHVLDITRGRPASGVTIEAFVLVPGQPPKRLSKMVTNADGRTDTSIIAPEQVKAGIYELVFHIGDYFAGTRNDDGIPYLGTVPIRVGITDAAAHYHVALLVSPWSYTTYRGS